MIFYSYPVVIRNEKRNIYANEVVSDEHLLDRDSTTEVGLFNIKIILYDHNYILQEEINYLKQMFPSND